MRLYVVPTLAGVLLATLVATVWASSLIVVFP
jgi:hypothetical protein